MSSPQNPMDSLPPTSPQSTAPKPPVILKGPRRIAENPPRTSKKEPSSTTPTEIPVTTEIQNLLPEEMLPLKSGNTEPQDLKLPVRRALAILEGATDLQIAQSGGIMLSDLAFTDPSLVFGSAETLGQSLRPAMRALLLSRGNELMEDTFCRDDELALFHVAARMGVVLAWIGRDAS